MVRFLKYARITKLKCVEIYGYIMLTEEKRSEIVETALALSPKPIVIESVWDGDTIGWILDLRAIQPERKEVVLVRLRGDGGDFRLFRGIVPPWPEIEEAKLLGERIASLLEIEYYAAPDKPDDLAPRWWNQGH